MNKIIPFSKDIHFKDKIGEIVSIKMEDDLKFDNEYSIIGNLIVSGVNKYEEIENTFSYPLPVEIAIDSKYLTNNASIQVDDFYYEIINDDILRVNIDLCLDNLSYKEERNMDLDILNTNDLIDTKIDVQADEVIEPPKEIDKQDDLKNTQENKEYSIYRVYTVMEGDTLDSVLSKYKITREELEIYNDLSNITNGVKLIIPSIDE